MQEILLPSACVALYRREMLAEIGFFDDDFFAYAEDSDLGLRSRLADWEALAATNAVVYHKYSQSGGVFSPLKVYLVERNHYWVALKSFPLHLLLLLPLYTAVRCAEQALAELAGHGSGGQFAASGSRDEIVRALLRGIRDGAAGIPRNWKKRREIMKTRRISGSQMTRLLARHHLSFRALLDR